MFLALAGLLVANATPSGMLPVSTVTLQIWYEPEDRNMCNSTTADQEEEFYILGPCMEWPISHGIKFGQCQDHPVGSENETLTCTDGGKERPCRVMYSCKQSNNPFNVTSNADKLAYASFILLLVLIPINMACWWRIAHRVFDIEQAR